LPGFANHLYELEIDLYIEIENRYYSAYRKMKMMRQQKLSSLKQKDIQTSFERSACQALAKKA
jgi:hypothetical protein